MEINICEICHRRRNCPYDRKNNHECDQFIHIKNNHAHIGWNGDY